MSAPERQPPVRAIADLLAAFKEIGAPHMIIGGLAVFARGVVRHTDDADATVWAADGDLPELLEAFRARDIVGRIPDILSFAAQSQVLLLRHQPSGVPIDVSLAWLPFERDALSRAQLISVEGVAIPMASRARPHRLQDHRVARARSPRRGGFAAKQRTVLSGRDAEQAVARPAHGRRGLGVRLGRAYRVRGAWSGLAQEI
jgi:hypothetical protein